MRKQRTYGLHDSAGYWVNRLAGTMHEAFDRAAANLNVTAAQWAVLVSVYNGDAGTPGDLAQFIGINRAAITRLLDRLESKGLIARHAHGSDRRALQIKLTSAGLRLVPKVAAVSRAENSRFLAHLTVADQTQFMRLLRRMIQTADR